MADDLLERHPVHVLLADGTTARIRPALPGDHDRLRGLYEEMAPENLRLRFFSASRRSGTLAADRACAPVRPGHRALLAEADWRVIGLAEYDTGGAGETGEKGAGDTGKKTEAEISIAVADGLYHRGVGTLLVEHLVSAARCEGITTFTADALSENHEILRLFADHAAHLAPLTDRDVHELITSPRCAPLLLGANGHTPVDFERLEQLLLRLSRMAADLPQLAEVDLDPVLATPGGVTVLDARVRLLPRRPQDPYLCRLR